MDLNGIWLLKGKDEQGDPLSLPATVPGCVHTDLMANGKIKNLYYRDNPLKAQWIEQNDFTYLYASVSYKKQSCAFTLYAL